MKIYFFFFFCLTWSYEFTGGLLMMRVVLCYIMFDLLDCCNNLGSLYLEL